MAKGTVLDLDTCQMALTLFKRYGARASEHAATRLKGMILAGDLAGATEWRRVLDAVEEVQRERQRELLN